MELRFVITSDWDAALVAIQCLHSLNAEQLSLKPPMTRLAKLSADTAHNVP